MKNQIKAWITGMMMGLLASCSTITEELPLCTHQLAFRYDYNMKYVDAFPVAVKKVEVFVFDADDRFVTSYSEEREAFGPHFEMPLSLPEGKYHLVAWAGRYQRSYAFNETLIPGVSTPADLSVKLHRSAGVSNQELDALWHGETRVELTQEGSQTIILGLTKDTNKFRIVVQGDSSWEGEELQFSITDANGWLGADNRLLPDSEIEYRPYFQELKEIDGEINAASVSVPSRYGQKDIHPVKKTADQEKPATGKLKVAVAELNTLRLIEGTHPHLRIAYPDGSKIIDIDLIPYLLLTKMEGHDMTAQEYLDRQDEYALIFFLSQNQLGQFVVMKIQVNGWVIRLQPGEL